MQKRPITGKIYQQGPRKRPSWADYHPTRTQNGFGTDSFGSSWWGGNENSEPTFNDADAEIAKPRCHHCKNPGYQEITATC